MPFRTPPPESDLPGEQPEFTFHLVFKKSASGESPGIVGAIVAGAVTTFIGDALGSAASKPDDPKGPKKSPPLHAVSKIKLASDKKGKPKRRRRSTRITRKP